jgi:hypothetical protein
VTRIRKKCQRDGHIFREIAGVHLPYVFCSRWFCDGCAVSVWAPTILAVEMHNAIPIEMRFPPVDLNADGTIKARHRGEPDEEGEE